MKKEYPLKLCFIAVTIKIIHFLCRHDPQTRRKLSMLLYMLQSHSRFNLFVFFEKLSYPCESHLMPYKKTAKKLLRTATTFNSIVNGHKLELSCINTHHFCFFSLHRIHNLASQHGVNSCKLVVGRLQEIPLLTGCNNNDKYHNG